MVNESGLPNESLEDKLRNYILAEVDESKAFQQDRIKEVREYRKRYEAKRSISGLMGWGDDPKKNPKTEPWEGCSDIGIPLDAFTIEGLLPRFLKVCYGSKPIVWVRGIGEQDQKPAPIVEKALNYQLTRLIKIYRRMKLVFKTVVMEGDAITKCVWESRTRPFNKVVYYLEDPYTGQLILGEDDKPVQVEKDFVPEADEFGASPRVIKDEIQDEKVIYEGPMVYGRTIKEVIIPKNAISPEIDELDWICDTYEKTFDWLSRREGDIKEGKFKNIDQIREKIFQTDPLLSANHNKAMRKPVLIYEWYGKYDIDEDGKDEEIIAFVCPIYKILLGWMLSPFQVRPFFHYQIIPMEGSFFGKGVPEFLVGLRDMTDAVFNQMIDRGSITNNPPILTPDSHEDELNPFGPGVKWKTENASGYKVLELPKSEQMEFAKMEFLLGMVQKLFGVTDYSLGSESSIASNRTATGIRTIVGEGNIKFDDMIRALQDVNEDLYNFIVNLNSENLDDDFIFQLTEQEGNPFKSINKSSWGGNYDFESVGNSVNINREIEQDRASFAYRTVVDSLGKNPAITEETMIFVTEHLFRIIDLRGVPLNTIENIQKQKEEGASLQEQIAQMQQALAEAGIMEKQSKAELNKAKAAESEVDAAVKGAEAVVNVTKVTEEATSEA